MVPVLPLQLGDHGGCGTLTQVRDRAAERGCG